MNQGNKIRSVVVKQVSKWMIIVLTRVKVWRVASTLLPTSSIEYPATNYPLPSLPPSPIHLPLGDVFLINKNYKTWILVVVQFYPRLILIFIYPASSDFSRLDAKLRRERNHCEQLSTFPLSMHVHVMLPQNVKTLPLVSQETLGT